MSKKVSKKEVKRIYVVLDDDKCHYADLSDLIASECDDDNREFDVEVYKLEKTIHVEFDCQPRITVDGKEWDG